MYFIILLAIVLQKIFTERIPPFDVRDDELMTMSKKLRDVDENKVRPGQVSINFQGHTRTSDLQDNALKKLFENVHPSLLNRPSYNQFIALADNFNRETGVLEPRVSTEEDRRETSRFLSTVLQSKPWKILYEFLKQKGHPFAKTPAIFRFWITQLWFSHYSRAYGRADTSGFEHIFMGEEKNKEISGLHNWLRFYMLEKNVTEDFDYKGFIIKRGNVMAAVKFTWKGDLKRSGSLLIGTSPEFDMALYTLCFLSRRGRQECKIELDGCPISITSYELIQNNKVFIGTIFPTAGPLTNQCRLNG
ncbi:endoribonuclease XendoU [Dictyocaulus viviparus]|uniref:Endoribonuclease XendoU n=1 Tax=Dictyocaulus viviparus TaxID=29172 RepID=A0A0D8XBH3_DICVI|nr:endoribonuclease XendoU [Dictyocaulus viviparus]